MCNSECKFWDLGFRNTSSERKCLSWGSVNNGHASFSIPCQMPLGYMSEDLGHNFLELVHLLQGFGL